MNEEKISTYVKNHAHSPLFFARYKVLGNSFTEPEQPESYDSLQELIKWILVTAENHYSLNKEKHETYPGTWRSSIDIWRHVKCFEPEITIFEVMRTLYEMKELLVGHYCTTIHRRVFHLRELHPGCELQDICNDEYRIHFKSWGNVGLPVEEENIEEEKVEVENV